MYEYKAIPAPTRPLKRKGLKTVEDRFAATLSEAMNTAASDGWEYVRADTLPCEERSGLTSRVRRFQTVLVFRRSLRPQMGETMETSTGSGPLQLLPAPGRALAEPSDAPPETERPAAPQADAPRSETTMPAQHDDTPMPPPAAPQFQRETAAETAPPAPRPMPDTGPAEPTAPRRVPTFADARIEQRRVDRIAPETLTVLNSMKGARPDPDDEDHDETPPPRPER